MTAFEDLMNQWAARSEDERRLRLTQRILAFGMLVGRSCAFYEQPDLHDDLLRRLDYDRIVGVTLNYDLLFEEAILRSGRRFTYPELPGIGGTAFVTEGEGDSVGIYKLHGSINWTAPSGTVSGTDLAFLPQRRRL